jgi:hypothetical protein
MLLFILLAFDCTWPVALRFLGGIVRAMKSVKKKKESYFEKISKRHNATEQRNLF